MEKANVLMAGLILITSLCVSQLCLADNCQDAIKSLASTIQASNNSDQIEDIVISLNKFNDVGSTSDLKACKGKSQSLVNYVSDGLRMSNQITNAVAVGLVNQLERVRQNCK